MTLEIHFKKKKKIKQKQTVKSNIHCVREWKIFLSFPYKIFQVF